MYRGKIKLFALILLITFEGCKKADEYPRTPVITFKSLKTTKDAGGFDTKASVVISFTDGDGDIGYRQRGENGFPYDDPNSIYYNNFIVTGFQKKNGLWVADTINLSGRVPYLTPEGINKALKGDIAMDLFLPAPVTNDTLRYSIFIYDRLFHQSNTVTTSEIIIRTQ